MTTNISYERHVKDCLYDEYKPYTKLILHPCDPPTGVRNAAISIGLCPFGTQ